MKKRWSLGFIRSERQASRFVLACMVFGFLALFGAAGAAGLATLRSQDHARWVEHTYEVQGRISTLRVLVERLEVSRRGYLLGHSEGTRRTFVETVRLVPPLIDDVGRLTIDNPRQRLLVAEVKQLMTQQMGLQSSSIALAARAPDAAITMFREDRSFGITRRLRAATAAMLEEENRLLVLRVRDQRLAVRELFGALGVFAVMALLVAIFSLAVLRRYTSSLVESRDAIQTLNAELEDRVIERTRDLSRANEEIQRFAYIVSHDLRSPLVNVMGFTGELEAATKPLAALVDRVEAEAPYMLEADATVAAREDLPEAIGFIRTSTQKMDRLINAILRLSREGKRVLAPERLDLVAMGEAIVGSLQHRLDDTGTTVVIERPMPSFVADRLAVEQMLSNLIENAVKYRKPGVPARVVVSGRAERGHVLIEVADNGRGIDPRDHDRIFDLFRRSGPQDQPGEGIGLAHVRALAYRLGGLIDCRSALGEGATFILSLPETPLVPVSHA